MRLVGTQTQKNLLAAFSNECQAYVKYKMIASMIEDEGYDQIAGFLEETARNEKEHAEVFYKLVMGESDSPEEALKTSANNENYEWTDMYKNFAEVAKEEGFPEIAEQFERISRIELRHEERFLKLLENIKKERCFKRDEEQNWVCRKCGNLHVGLEAPEKCPVCGHKQEDYEILATNY